MTLRKFKDFIRDRQKPVSERLEQNFLKEDVADTPITDAATVFIGGELSMTERRLLMDDFVNYIERMGEGGRSIMAIAAAFD
jgi:hypothetical protein